MAQPFSLRYMLVDGQGNFGSIDGDSAAAMRYTEIRLAKIAHELMADLEKETVDFVDNYDGTEKIPDVMPTKIPNLLVNGSSGIAVGMATNIPPHNLTEVINGCLAYIDDEDISIEGLMEHIRGRTSRRRQSLTVVAVLKKLTVPVAARCISALAQKWKLTPKPVVKPLSSTKFRIR